MISSSYSRCVGLLVLSLGCGAILSGCSTLGDWMRFNGPNGQQVVEVQNTAPDLPIQVVEVTDKVARRVFASQKRNLFSETLGNKAPVGYTVGRGDTIEVSIWEAPPAALFGSSGLDPNTGAATTQVTTFPEQMVSSEGTINIPFAGAVPAAGMSPQQIEAEVVRRLTDKAHQPQVLVRIKQNASSKVTIVGEVQTSLRMPLTAGGERLLDALAAAGGVRQPVDLVMLQVTRGDQNQALPLGTIIRDQKQNIVLQPGDVITALFQPLSLTTMGATGKNQEVKFEAQGITLAQALARSGGLDGNTADARAVFIFRFEDVKALDWPSPPVTTPEGKVPVIYRVNMKDPVGFFVAQNFPMNNKDVLYVAQSPTVEFQKFMAYIFQAVFIMRTLTSL